MVLYSWYPVSLGQKVHILITWHMFDQGIWLSPCIGVIAACCARILAAFPWENLGIMHNNCLLLSSRSDPHNGQLHVCFTCDSQYSPDMMLCDHIHNIWTLQLPVHGQPRFKTFHHICNQVNKKVQLYSQIGLDMCNSAFPCSLWPFSRWA